MMYQRIFVPVDDSSPSSLALTEAIKLATSLGSKLIIAHGVDLPLYGRGNPEVLDSNAMEMPQITAAGETLQAACDRARAGGLEIESVLLENRGDPISTILLEAAHHAQAELIVMGTHGRSGIMHLLLGSVAEGVLRAADLPILLVRGE
jgi:nucleotide-binding universal stress UspA family protein